MKIRQIVFQSIDPSNDGVRILI